MQRLRGFSENYSRVSWILARIVGTLAMGLIAIGCSERPRVVAKGEALPVGDFELRVVSVSMVDADRTAPSKWEGLSGSSMRATSGGLLLGVNWDESYETLTFRLFAHEDSGLTLLIKNVAKKAGQPSLFAVPLE